MSSAIGAQGAARSIPFATPEDYAWLRDWVRPECLSEEALREYRSRFESHPARILLIEHFLHDSVAARISRFLLTEAAFEDRFGLYGPNGSYMVEEKEWAAAPSESQFYRARRLSDARPEFRLSANLFAFLRLRKAITEPRFHAFVEMLTGTRLGPNSPPEAYALPEGSFLGPHTDRVYGRRIALVIYLNPEWEPEFGGALHIVQNDGAVARILPRRGSLLLFDVDTHKEHYIGVVTPQCGGQSRLTLSCWFENPRE